MFRIILTYPDGKDAKLDFDYYIGKHVPLTKALLGEHGLIDIQANRCLQTLEGDKPGFVCITVVDFSDKEAFDTAYAIHGETLLADIPNYTNIEPEVDICEVL